MLITGGSSAGSNLVTDIGANATAVVPDVLAAKAVEFQPAVYIEFEPFCSSHPFFFTLITHSAMMVVLPIYYCLGFTRRIIRLPRLRTMRKRLKTGGSRLGVILAHVNEQFDDCMIEGRLSSASAPMAFLTMGLLTTSWVIYTYAWRVSLNYASVPLANSLQYLYVLFVAPLMVPILKEKLNGLKLFASVLCFLGIYVYFFPDAAILSAHTHSDTIRAIALGIFGAFVFSLYLLLYRLTNPDGWMLKVIGVQGFGVFLFGTIFGALLHASGVEEFALPTRAPDVWMIIFHSTSRFCIIYCINEALRWGEPLAVATALTVIPPASYLLQSVFSVNAPPQTLGKVVSLILTLCGFAVVGAFHFSRAISGCTMLAAESLAYRAGATSSERKRLIVGSDYVI